MEPRQGTSIKTQTSKTPTAAATATPTKSTSEPNRLPEPEEEIPTRFSLTTVSVPEVPY